MAHPFRLRNHDASSHGLLKTMLRKLDIPNADPRAAEVELNNYFVRLSSLRDADHVAVGSIYDRFRLVGAERAVIQQRIVRALLLHQMQDDSLSADERGDLARVVKALGLDGATGKAMCCAIGKDIYMDRLTAARADGVISEEERHRLNNVRAIFALHVDVPSTGLDYDKAIGTCRQRAESEVHAVRTRIGYLWRAANAMREMNPVIGDHHHFKTCTACLAGWQDTVSDITYVIDNTPGADADSYSIITDATDRATELAAEIDRSSMDTQVNEILTWKRMTAKQVEKANTTAQRSAESERQTTCRVAAVQAGFGLERGSATARAWAYCVIAEECLTDPAWTELPSDTASADTDAGRFRAWLLMRPASFWTEVFPEGGMAVAKERFQAEEVSGRKRAKRRADLDLQIA